MRLYSFTNYYLSPIQQGIQTAHLVAVISKKKKTIYGDMYSSWATAHHTIIVLNGGNCFGLYDIFNKLEKLCAGTNFAQTISLFKEDEASLGGAVTAVGLIVPEEVYDASKDPFGDFRDLRNYLNGFKLA